MIHLNPIGYFKTHAIEKKDVPRQSSLEQGNRGLLQFLPHRNFEQALEDLRGFDKIWILFWMHQTEGWRPKVQPPRDVKKKGVFATRSPHRPNPIGLSCVRLLSIQGLTIEIEGHDLLDGSPILDVKPYLPYADSFPEAQIGWLEEETGEIERYEVDWSPLAQQQAQFIEGSFSDFRSKIAVRLRHFTLPSSSNRIKHLAEDCYELSYKTWRIVFRKDQTAQLICIVYVMSGYDCETLEGRKTSRWDDVPLHRLFLSEFQEKILPLSIRLS
jgi:tRNA (adenine37-N6)-methyltransferase